MIKWEDAFQSNLHYKIGMYGGKFIPFHKGHFFCLNTAALLCDKVYCILFYGGDQELEILRNDTILDKKYLSVKARKEELQYICSKFFSPNVIPIFIDVTNCKTADGKEDWDAETPLVLNACGKLDAVFSSEISYDDYFKRAYPWAEHILVDPPRENFPISATMLRNMTEEEAKKWFCKK